MDSYTELYKIPSCDRNIDIFARLKDGKSYELIELTGKFSTFLEHAVLVLPPPKLCFRNSDQREDSENLAGRIIYKGFNVSLLLMPVVNKEKHNEYCQLIILTSSLEND